MLNKTIIGALAVALSALLWSLDGTFLRPNLYVLPSPLVVFLEHLLGFVALSPLLIYFRGQLRLITKKQWLTIFWVALFGGALGTTFMTKALFLTGFKDISVVILLQKFQPLFAILLAAIFLRERFPRRFYMYALLAIIGGYFATFRDPFTITRLPQSTITIALLSLAAAFAWGSSTTFGKYSLKNINYGLLAALRFGFTVMIMAVPALYFYSSSLHGIPVKVWTTLLIIVFSSGALSMWLYYFGLNKIPASIATLCELAWPLSAVVMDYYFNHNVLTAYQTIGAIVLFWMVYRATALMKSRTITGTVITGTHTGATIGFRTANLLPERARGMARGLYSATVVFDGQTYSGLLYYGYNHLAKQMCLEVHILNFSGDLYGKNISVITEKFLRLPKKLDNPNDLAAQIKTDLKYSGQ